jgi:hypothetical protein
VAGGLGEADRRRSVAGRRHPLGERDGRGADERARREHVERARALADEVRRRLEPRLPANAAARQQRDPLLADEPGRRLGEVARVCVLWHEDRERPREPLVERRHDERQRRLRDARTRRKRLGEGVDPVVLEELPDECVEDRTVHDERRNRPVPRVRSVVRGHPLTAAYT